MTHANCPSQPPAGLVEEYRALRSELMWHMEARERNMVYFLTVASALLGYGIANNSPLVFAVVYVVATYFRRLDLNHRSAVYKLGAYIAAHLEPNLPGLAWERHVSKVDEIALPDQRLHPGAGWLSAFITRLAGPFQAFMIVSAVLVALQLKHICPSQYSWKCVALAGSPLVLIHLSLSWRVGRVTSSWLRQRWTQLFRNTR